MAILAFMIATPVLAEPTGTDRSEKQSDAAERANAEHDKGVDARAEGRHGEAVEHFAARDKDTWEAFDAATKGQTDKPDHDNDHGAADHDGEHEGAAGGNDGGGNGPAEHDGGGHDPG